VLVASNMTPKEPVIFFETLKALIHEINDILANETLTKDFRTLALKKNTFRSKCLKFLSLSFEDPQNEYKKEFEDNITEVSQLHLNNFNRSLPISFLLDQFNYAKSLFEKYIEVTEFVIDFRNHLPTESSDEGIFFKGQYFDAVYQLNKIISVAQTEIYLVDNYIDIDLLNFLKSAKQNISIKILTSNYNINNLNQVLRSFQQQYANVQVKETNTYHDRFLIIDNKFFYHFGASLKDLAKRTFMFSKINQPSIQQAFFNEFNAEWNIAQPIFP
jgi:hypothetical protein